MSDKDFVLTAWIIRNPNMGFYHNTLSLSENDAWDKFRSGNPLWRDFYIKEGYKAIEVEIRPKRIEPPDGSRLITKRWGVDL